MRFIPTRIHGILDYLLGAVLIAAPWLFNLGASNASTWLPVVLGVGIVAYSLVTNYEWGVAHAIPMPVHLMLDGLGGLFLAVSPWLLGFADVSWAPFLVLGLIEIGSALCTEVAAPTLPEPGM